MKNKSLKKAKSGPDLDEHMVLPALTSVMKMELVVNADADCVWLLHDKPFKGELHWMEYDEEFASITLVMVDGTIQDSGLTINEDVGLCLEEKRQLFTILTDGNKVKDMYMVPVVIRESFRS